MTQTVLFLCPHHAAKSVIAAAYFERLAREMGLDVRAESAGTEPDKAVMPVVVDLLLTEGIDVSGHQPRLVTAKQLAGAARIISMGCTAEALGIADEQMEHWTDIPMVSLHPAEASATIRRHVEQLAAALQTETA